MHQYENLMNELRARAGSGDRAVLKSAEMKSLFDEIKIMPNDKKAAFGKAMNEFRAELESLIGDETEVDERAPIDVTAPWDVNTHTGSSPTTFLASQGSIHPLNSEIDKIVDIFARMGFSSIESRQIDNDFNMFEALNFPEGHPARDDYDTFMTEEGLVAPAHTSTMQNRILSQNAHLLEQNQPIAYVVPGRVFRNEDLDATHEHTFHQVEGVYVGRNVHAGMLVATLKTYLKEYFQEDLAVKLQPYYFPFTEPSFEMAVERPAILRRDDSEEQRWLELVGCGMINPNVLRMAGIDPGVYTGFAWGFGVERMVMMKNQIEDIRHFNSGKLDFLRQF